MKSVWGVRSFGSWNLRVWVLLAVPLVAVTVVLLLPRIPQDPAYHAFADGRTIFGLRNFHNVVSNLAFLSAGVLGLGKYRVSRRSGLHPGFVVYCLAAIAVGLTSARYHLDPTTWTLVWDRLAMAVIMMAMLAMVVGDRVDAVLGRKILWPGVAVGVGSVLYWRHTELQGAGDLRLYGFAQFLPLALLLVILCAYRPRHLRSGYLWGGLGLYLLAKIGEHFDRWVYEASGFVSGHTLKHLFAAAGVLLVIGALQDTKALDDPSHDH